MNLKSIVCTTFMTLTLAACTSRYDPYLADNYYSGGPKGQLRSQASYDDEMRRLELIERRGRILEQASRLERSGTNHFDSAAKSGNDLACSFGSATCNKDTLIIQQR